MTISADQKFFERSQFLKELLENKLLPMLNLNLEDLEVYNIIIVDEETIRLRFEHFGCSGILDLKCPKSVTKEFLEMEYEQEEF